AQKVVLVGEGAGGAAAIAASDAGVSGVAVLSAPATAPTPSGDIDALGLIRQSNRPVLIMASLGDAGDAAAAGKLYDAVRDNGTRALFPGPARGADILK